MKKWKLRALLLFENINEVIIQSSRYIHFFSISELTALFSEENELHGTVFDAAKVAGSAKSEQSKIKSCCPLRSVCLFNKELKNNNNNKKQKTKKVCLFSLFRHNWNWSSLSSDQKSFPKKLRSVPLNLDWLFMARKSCCWTLLLFLWIG